MYFRNKDKAVAAAAGLTAGLWYVLGNIAVVLLNTIITKQWIAPETIGTVLPYLSHIFLFVQPPFAAFTGVTQQGFSFLYFIVGFIQIFVVAALAVWVGAKVYRFVRKD